MLRWRRTWPAVPTTLLLAACVAIAAGVITGSLRTTELRVGAHTYDSLTQILSEGPQLRPAGSARELGTLEGIAPGASALAAEAGGASTATTGSLEDAYAQLKAMGLRPVGGGAPGPLEGTAYTSKVLAQMAGGDAHGFPISVDSLATWDDAASVEGNDGQWYLHVNVAGARGGEQGFYQYIVDQQGMINHRLWSPMTSIDQFFGGA